MTIVFDSLLESFNYDHFDRENELCCEVLDCV